MSCQRGVKQWRTVIRLARPLGPTISRQPEATKYGERECGRLRNEMEIVQRKSASGWCKCNDRAANRRPGIAETRFRKHDQGRRVDWIRPDRCESGVEQIYDKPWRQSRISAF